MTELASFYDGLVKGADTEYEAYKYGNNSVHYGYDVLTRDSFKSNADYRSYVQGRADYHKHKKLL